MAEETPTFASSSSSGQVLQSEAFTLEGIEVALALDEPLGDPSALRAVEDPEGLYSPHNDDQNAPLAPVPASAHVIQTRTTTDQECEDNIQVLGHVDKKDHGYVTQNSEEDPPEDYNDDSDEDDQVDGKSFDQNISSLGTDEVERAALSEKRLHQDFSPTATPNDISVPKLTTSSIEPLQKSEKVEEEGVLVSVDIDHTSVDSDSQSFDQNISSLGTDEVERAALSEKRLHQDFSPTATPDDISVPNLTTSSFEPLQKSEKVESEKVESEEAVLVSVDIDHTLVDSDSQIAQNPELVIQCTGEGANMVTEEAKEDEVSGGMVLDQMNKMDEGGTNKVSSFGVDVTDKPAPATASPTTANDVRLAVPSLEPLLKPRAKLGERR